MAAVRSHVQDRWVGQDSGDKTGAKVAVHRLECLLLWSAPVNTQHIERPFKQSSQSIIGKNKCLTIGHSGAIIPFWTPFLLKEIKDLAACPQVIDLRCAPALNPGPLSSLRIALDLHGEQGDPGPRGQGEGPVPTVLAMVVD